VFVNGALKFDEVFDGNEVEISRKIHLYTTFLFVEFRFLKSMQKQSKGSHVDI